MISLLTLASFVHLTIFATDISKSNAVVQQEELVPRITLMYRRSGHTAQSYNRVSHLDTLHFYQRQGNPYFRVYTFQFNLTGVRVRQMMVESYSDDQLIKKVDTRLRPAGNQRYQGVDTYVDPDEDLVKITLTYHTEAATSVSEFVFFIAPDS